MKKFIIGEYRVTETIVAFLALCFLIFSDTVLYKSYSEGVFLGKRFLITVAYINIIGFVFIAMPYLRKKLNGISQEKINNFLNFPNGDEKITFSQITSFLSSQALASYIMTMMAFAAKPIDAQFGELFAVLMMLFMMLLALVIAAESLVRTVMYYKNVSGFLYFIVCLVTLLILYIFIVVGFKLGI